MMEEKNTYSGKKTNGSAGALPSRKHPAHGVLMNTNKPTVVFLTVCTKGRQPWLAESETHALLHSVWTDASAWLVGKYIIMPDHVHLFAAPGLIEESTRLSRSFALPAAAIPFDNWVRYWKSQFSKRHRNPVHRWQTDHWDTRLRRSESYASKWEYVRNNPVRHGLVERAEDWPFQGKIHDLPW